MICLKKYSVLESRLDTAHRRRFLDRHAAEIGSAGKGREHTVYHRYHILVSRCVLIHSVRLQGTATTKEHCSRFQV